MIDQENTEDVTEGERGLEKALGKIGKTLDQFKEEVKKKGDYKDFIIIDYYPASQFVVGKNSIDSKDRIKIDISRFYNKRKDEFVR